MTRVHLMLTALLPILLWCTGSVLGINTCSASEKERSGEDAFVSLSQSNASGISVLYGDTKSLHCSGYASSHGKITWHLYKSDSRGCLPIHGYWSIYNHYDIQSSIDKDGRVDSTLTIDRFSDRYVGFYYCILTSGGEKPAAEVSSAMNVTLVPIIDPRPSDGPNTEALPTTPEVDYRLKLNITVEKINDSLVLIQWEKEQRSNGINFCKNRYKWMLEVLTWEHSELPNVLKHIWNQSFVHNASKVRTTIELSSADCYNNRTYLNIDLSNNSYYKFQIKVNRTKNKAPDTIVLGSDFYGSYLHYFGNQNSPTISYPQHNQRIPLSDDPCIFSGEPKPLLQVLSNVLVPTALACIVTAYHVNPPNIYTIPMDIVNFFVEPPTVTEIIPQSRCESYKVQNGVCRAYIPWGIMVNITSNISSLEERALTIFAQIEDGHNNCKSLMKAFICNSLFPRCHPDGMQRSVCQQSCLKVKECGGKTFQIIQGDLPPSSDASGNCTNLIDTKAGDAPECILLTPPDEDEEPYTDGSCLVGRGQEYTGTVNVTESGHSCLPWSQQEFYHLSMFPGLQSAGTACRNPGGTGDRLWCYVNLANDAASVRWEYCDIPKCPSCEPVPDICKDVGYSRSDSVFIKNDGQQQIDTIDECIPDSDSNPCYNAWKNIACHLTYPNCVPSTLINQMHTARPLCKTYCKRIKEIIHADGACPKPSGCVMSMLVHQLPEDCSMLPENDCITAELEPPTTNSESVATDDNSHKQGHLALSIFVAAAVCLISVLTIAGIVIGYCCCCYCGTEPARNALIKPIPNPLDNPVFATMKFKYITNPDYSKSPIESTSAFADKSLRPISKTQIHYIRDLGSGNFGLVYQGKVEKIMEGEEFTMAAIKTLREGSSAEGMKNFLHEAKLACQFDHDNIIKLYGICMSEGFYCLVFEYMDLGDLNEYLRGSASSTQRRIMNPLDSTSRSRTESSLSNNPPRLNVQQLVSICHQIALGMEYFASLNHVHRDLATRNCLVATGLVVKIGDFGMSQTLYHSDYYKQRGEQALPVRWMAPEAFIYGRFSSEGDIWSFGVVMWEVFSFAMQPYYGKMNDQVMNEVRRGHTLSHPDDCPSSIFEIMRSCWQMEPHRRPNFSELVDELHTWRPTHCSTSTALESQGSIQDDIEDSVSLPSIQDKDVDLESSVFDDCNMSGTEEDVAD